MSINIVKWVWDLGNGEVISTEFPQTIYVTGNYDVKFDYEYQRNLFWMIYRHFTISWS